MIKRTQEGLQWPIDRKIEHDLRNWPPRNKQCCTNEHSGSDSKNKVNSKPVDFDGFKNGGATCVE